MASVFPFLNGNLSSSFHRLNACRQFAIRVLFITFTVFTLFTQISCSEISSTSQLQKKIRHEDALVNSVNKLEIFPKDAVVTKGSSVVFAAIGYRNNENHGTGLNIVWKAYDSKNQELKLSRQGKFSPQNTGKYQIIATTGKHIAQTSLTVEEPTIPQSLQMLLPERDTGWNDENSSTAFEPGQQRGYDPYAKQQNGLINSPSVKAYQAGNSNFTLSVPIASLPGRGIDLNLSLRYNSNLWHKSGRKLRFDIDGDWPVPGWTLGFGKVVLLSYTNPEQTMLVDADGTRHAFETKSISNSVDLTEYQRLSTDGTLIQLNYATVNQVISSVFARYPNGTIVEFTTLSKTRRTLYPTKITDRNGNYLTITYRNNTGPELERIIDTLGRVFSFHYDVEDRLTAIVGPGLWGDARELIRLHYKEFPLQYEFNPQNYNSDDINAPDKISVIDAVYYPGTRTGYWFGDSDSYSSYGMLTKVLKQREMSFLTTGLNSQGSVTKGRNTRQLWYNYLLKPDPNLPKPPTYTKSGECWEKMDKGSNPEPDVMKCPDDMDAPAPIVSKFSVVEGSDRQVVEVILPEGTAIKRLSYKKMPSQQKPEKWQEGLVYQEQTFDYLHDWKLLKSTLTSWEPGNGYGPRKTRVEEIDELNQRKAVEFAYTPEHNQILEVREYDYGTYGRMVWSSAGSIPGKKCIQIIESADPDSWDNNYLCSDVDFHFAWSSNGQIADKHCIQINEPSEPNTNTWDDNFLCSDKDYGFHWSYAGPISGEDCVQFLEPSDQHTWSDNFLCRNKTGLLRTTRTRYENQELFGAYIVILPTSIEVYSANNSQPDSRTDHQYDGSALKAIPNVVQHDPELPFSLRGNLTTTTFYPDLPKLSNPIIEQRNYDNTGNLILISKAAGQEIQISYSGLTHYTFPDKTVTGSRDPNSNVRLTRSTTYDLFTGLVLSETDINGRVTGFSYDPQSLRLSRKTQTTSGAVDFEITYAYDDSLLTTTQETTSEGQLISKNITYLNGAGLSRQTDSLAKLGNASEPDEWNVTETKYDQRGRVWKQSRPWLRKGNQSRNGLEWSYGWATTLPKYLAINDPEKTDNYWQDNAIATDANYGFAWSPNGPIPGKNCVAIEEPSDLQWKNNYLCTDTDYGLQWSYSGRISGKSCLQFEEPSEQTYWNDNFLCIDKQRGQVIHWSETTYDALGRMTLSKAPDGRHTFFYFNEPTVPIGASTNPGTRIRSFDGWQRERWSRTDALGRLVEVVQDGTSTKHNYNALDKLVQVTQQEQSRRFRYDSLGRLSHEYLPEKNHTLDDQGSYTGNQGQWSDVYTYDNRSNLKTHIDARGIKTVYDYASDPLDRLQSVSYDTSGFGDTSHPIQPAPKVNYRYRETGDVTSLKQIDVDGIEIETFNYKPSGLLQSKTVTLMSQPDHPFVIDYGYNRVDRMTEIHYPKRYGLPKEERPSVKYDYDVAGRISNVSVDGKNHASGIGYNAASQTTGMAIGDSGLSEQESYEYEETTGLLAHQWVQRGDKRLLDLTYNYLPFDSSGLAAFRSGRSGQLTRTYNNLNGKSYEYDYDNLGRLVTAVGYNRPFPDRTVGKPGYWKQKYEYDPYGNRTAVKATQFPGGIFTCPPGPGACEPPEQPATPDMRDGLESVTYENKTNRITAPGYEYDAAGNLVRLPREDGKFYQLQYDAVGRLAAVKDADGTERLVYAYGADRKRLSVDDKLAGRSDYYIWKGNAVIAEYNKANSDTPLSLSLNYLYLGDRMLSTLQPRNHLDNAQFEEKGESGSPVTFTGERGERFSAAKDWSLWNNTFGTNITELIPTTLSNNGTQMLRVSTTGKGMGIVQTFPTINASNEDVKASAWLYVKKGKVGIGVGSVGAFSPDTVNTGTNRWEFLEVKNKTSPVNEIIIYSVSDDGAEFYVDSASVTQTKSAETQVQFWHPDRLGTRLVTNAEHDEAIEQTTLPFGNPLDADSSPTAKNQKRRFTSYERDLSVTKLDYAANRFYDSVQGRFLQADPIGMASASLYNPQSLNMYAYVQSDPINGTDLTGLLYPDDLWVCVDGGFCYPSGDSGIPGGAFWASNINLLEECASNNLKSCRNYYGDWKFQQMSPIESEPFLDLDKPPHEQQIEYKIRIIDLPNTDPKIYIDPSQIPQEPLPLGPDDPIPYPETFQAKSNGQIRKKISS